MLYTRTKWTHKFPNEPVEILSEIDDRQDELRKVEIFEDGRMQAAGANFHTLNTALSLEPLPSIEEINKDTQFSCKEISRNEFERIWQACL